MFNEEEKRLIKKYCLLPKLSIAFLIMALLIGFVWILFVMINDMVFNGTFYMLGLYTFLGIAIIYTIAFIICKMIPQMGMRKEKWQEIVKKANVFMSNNDYSSDISENAKLVAAICGIEIPKAKKYILSIILLPILLLTIVFIPQYMSSKQNADANIVLASKSVYALQTSLQQECDHVSIDDPKEDYNDSGYQVTGYLYDYNEPYNSYIVVTVGNDGLINDVRYSIDVNLDASKEENLIKAESDLTKLNGMMNNSGVKAQSYDLLQEYTLPKDFQSQFNTISYYEDLNFQKNEHVSIDYMTDSKEDYDEYSDSYIYISIVAN